MSTSGRRTGIIAAVLACFLAASLAEWHTPSAKAEQGSPTAAGPAVESKPTPVPQAKTYTARAVLQVPLSFPPGVVGGMGGGTSGVTGNVIVLPAEITVRNVLSSLETYRTAANEPEDQLFAMAAGTRMRALEQVGGATILTIESSSVKSAEALRAVELASTRLREVFDEQIRRDFLQGGQELPLNATDLEKLRNKYEDENKAVLEILGPFGTFSHDAPTAVDEAGKEKQKLDHEILGTTQEIRGLEMNSAVDKAVADSMEQRLAKEAEAAQKAEKEDPISRELQTLVELAESEYTRVADLFAKKVASTEELNQKKKVVAESRLALLRRKEELSNRAAGPEFAKLKEDLIGREQNVVAVDARLNNLRHREAELEGEVGKFSKALREAEPLSKDVQDLRYRYNVGIQLGQQPKTIILWPPSLVAVPGS